MDSFYQEAVNVAVNKHPKQCTHTINYGTAGFRSKADELDHIIYRMGLLAVLRSKCKKANIGVMITASHNPEEDNGIKLVDPHGEMLEATWEVYATQLANVSDPEIGSALLNIASVANIDTNVPAEIIVARDTRPSSERFANTLKDGIEALGGEMKDFGVLTTPQLHYMVCCTNTKGKYGNPTEEGYYQKLSYAFCTLRGKEVSRGQYSPNLQIDGANGVGALKLQALMPHLGDSINIDIVNNGSSGKLNYLCGADYVKVQQKPPQGVVMQQGMRYASFDGDADRIVYYYQDNDGQFQLLDGDKIATLVASYLRELLTECGISLNLGLVQTAYANGSSTNYITQHLKVPVACVPTGVKHLHHKALTYDIGVYFEANGHGTVLFSDEAIQQINRTSLNKSLSDKQQDSAQCLAYIVDVINQTVGDAISDMLLVETILHAKGWSTLDWNACYTDLPNRQLKVKVKDRTVIQTTDAERKATSPPGLQEAIDILVAKYAQGRSFVRPSGTEDVVRVYAEADTQANADLLAHEVSIKLFDMAGGEGDPPKPL